MENANVALQLRMRYHCHCEGLSQSYPTFTILGEPGALEERCTEGLTA